MEGDHHRILAEQEQRGAGWADLGHLEPGRAPGTCRTRWAAVHRNRQRQTRIGLHLAGWVALPQEAQGEAFDPLTQPLPPDVVSKLLYPKYLERMARCAPNPTPTLCRTKATAAMRSRCWELNAPACCVLHLPAGPSCEERWVVLKLLMHLSCARRLGLIDPEEAQAEAAHGWGSEEGAGTDSGPAAVAAPPAEPAPSAPAAAAAQ